MAQRTRQLYRLLAIPAFYRWLQIRFGGVEGRARLIDEVIRPKPGMRILDVGCGPAAILSQLPVTDYTGIDMNARHIAAARQAYPTRGKFVCGDVAELAKQNGGAFDIVLALGLLHHLSDDECKRLFSSLERLVAPDGRIITLDAVYLPRQRLVANLLARLDSGLNVRSPEAYADLPDRAAFSRETKIYHDLSGIPYDHFCMILRPIRSDWA